MQWARPWCSSEQQSARVLAGLQSDPSDIDQKIFDERRRAACTKLCRVYQEAGYADLRMGRAQKWLNMALKYVFVISEDRLPGYKRVFALAHVPPDQITSNRSFAGEHPLSAPHGLGCVLTTST